MAILDQFETFRHTDYSASYTDNVIVLISGSITNGGRKVLGNKIYNRITSASLSPYEMPYSTYLNYVSGNILGKNYGFVGLDAIEETVFDSLMPSPVDFHVANGAELISVASVLTTSNDLNTPTFASGTAFAIRFANSNVTQSNLKIDYTGNYAYDIHWAASFPFEKKYKSLLRLKSLNNILVKSYRVNGVESDPYGAIGVLTPAKTSNIFTGQLAFIEKNLSSDWGGGEENVLSVLTEISKSAAITKLQAANTDLLQKITNVNVLNIAPNLRETYKMYFGIGRKTWPRAADDTLMFESGKTANYIDFSLHTNGTESSGLTSRLGRINFGVIPAGWKYGVYNALPTSTKLIFRRNRFGQFRDILEQRIFTKFSLAEKNTTTTSPVSVTFISGTAAYVTATNDSTLNTRDSGIYRREYTSGKPFADD
jgi:hypothetical protein